MSYQRGDGKWNDAERLVTFMIFDAMTEVPSEIIRGILMSRGIPFFFFEHTKAKPASITVPVSRLKDAKRAVEQARSIGAEIEGRGLFKD
jgi:hypothetical protein